MSHAKDFGQESGREDVAKQLVLDYRQAELSPQERRLCDYAIKLTLAPARMGKSDTDRLRECGFNDEQITVAAQVIGYFNYINRIADGLGVDDEDWMNSLSHQEWEQQRGREGTLQGDSGRAEDPHACIVERRSLREANRVHVHVDQLVLRGLKLTEADGELVKRGFEQRLQEIL